MKNPYILPVTSQPNQTFKTVVPLGKRNVEVTIGLSFREIAGYWTMNITNREGTMVLSNLPLLRGDNLLAPYSYLDLGDLRVVERNPTGQDSPNSAQLGTDFVLVWGESDV